MLELLQGIFGTAPWVTQLSAILGVVIISSFALLIVIFLIWEERKVIARIQDRIGPNRVGPYGLGQSFADIVKLLIKEQITPAGADKVAYNTAPILIVVMAVMMWAVMPFGPGIIGADLNIGVFYILAISSVSVVAVLLAGWGSNNKYALLGAFRSVAQLVSYEVPMVIALLVPILLARSMSTVDIIEAQTVPFFFMAPLSLLIFFISALAETGRTPFDLLEAESEIIAGFHVEYSGMKFAMFQLAEFVSAYFMSCMIAVIYFGGWNIPLINLVIRLFGGAPLDITQWGIAGSIFGVAVFFFKSMVFYFCFIWIRGTLPRVRIDQILDFNWKFLVPISLVLILVVAVLDKLIPASAGDVGRGVIHFLANVAIMFGVVEVLRRRGRANRLAAEDEPEADAGHDDHAHAVPAH
ncbi:MAG: NADH-quinone oxidoreductase subunit NuoH [Candidatus Promineifilaceae bacterium]